MFSQQTLQLIHHHLIKGLYNYCLMTADYQELETTGEQPPLRASQTYLLWYNPQTAAVDPHPTPRSTPSHPSQSTGNSSFINTLLLEITCLRRSSR